MYLVLNAGSSTVKFALYTAKLQVAARGLVDGIGRLRCELRLGGVRRPCRARTHRDAIALILEALRPHGLSAATLAGVGHRVVHGGARFTRPTRITRAVRRAIARLCRMAPLHNPHNLAGIDACVRLLPRTPQVAVFDTGFHATLPEDAYLYALPLALSRKLGLRKYGFHGISYQSIARQIPRVLGRRPRRVIICHLGNGASLCALKNGRSIETSMGFTPLDGLVMGTRAGALDPGVLLYLLSAGHSSARLDALLHHASGLKGLTGTADLRDIHAGRGVTPAARRRALAVMTHRLAHYIGGYATLLGGLDALVFTAGIGEGAPYVRAQTCRRLSAWGVRLDAAKNRRHEPVISARTSRVAVLVLHTNEEQEIARAARALTP